MGNHSLLKSYLLLVCIGQREKININLLHLIIFFLRKDNIVLFFPFAALHFSRYRHSNIYIEAGFQKQLKNTVVFIDLTAVYDTIWNQGLIYKLHTTIIPCKKRRRLLHTMLTDRSFGIIMVKKRSKKIY